MINVVNIVYLKNKSYFFQVYTVKGRVKIGLLQTLYLKYPGEKKICQKCLYPSIVLFSVKVLEK